MMRLGYHFGSAAVGQMACGGRQTGDPLDCQVTFGYTFGTQHVTTHTLRSAMK